MAKIPLTVRLGIREDWDKEDCQLQVSRGHLADLVGMQFVFMVNWEHLWQVLGPQFPEPELFVPSMARVALAWCDELAARLDLDEDNEWADKFINSLSNVQSVEIEVVTGKGDKPKTNRNKNGPSFTLSVPETEPTDTTSREYGARELAARRQFSLDFEDLFASEDTAQPEAAPIEEPDWDDVVAEERPQRVVTTHHSTSTSSQGRAVANILPSTKSLPRPENLFLATVPYRIIVNASPKLVVIQGSHGPSLELIAEYFKKWMRNLPQTTDVPILRIRLGDSFFGMGTSFDTIEIETTRERNPWYSINPVTILTFIETILGYTEVFQDRGVWHFKRDTPLKR